METFEKMLGQTMVEVTGAVGSEEMRFTAADGQRHVFYHSQDCCEKVSISDVVGDLDDLVGSPILQAEEVGSGGSAPPESADSFTWTFYKFATAKGSVTVRWLGESSGYYSESVDYRQLPAITP